MDGRREKNEKGWFVGVGRFGRAEKWMDGWMDEGLYMGMEIFGFWTSGR